MIAGAVRAIFDCLVRILYEDFFRTHHNQYLVTVVKVGRRYNMDSLIFCLAEALAGRRKHAIKMVAGSNKGCGKDRTWVIVDLFGQIELFYMAFGHDCDAVRDRQRLLLVVCYVDRRHLQLLLDPANLVTQRDAHLGVKRGEWFIEQKHLWLDCQGARQRDTLLLSS